MKDQPEETTMAAHTLATRRWTVESRFLHRGHVVIVQPADPAPDDDPEELAEWVRMRLTPDPVATTDGIRNWQMFGFVVPPDDPAGPAMAVWSIPDDGQPVTGADLDRMAVRLGPQTAEPVTPEDAVKELIEHYDRQHPDAAPIARGGVLFALREALGAVDALRQELRQASEGKRS